MLVITPSGRSMRCGTSGSRGAATAAKDAVTAWTDEARDNEQQKSEENLTLKELHNSDNRDHGGDEPQNHFDDLHSQGSLVDPSGLSALYPCRHRVSPRVRVRPEAGGRLSATWEIYEPTRVARGGVCEGEPRLPTGVVEGLIENL